MSRTAARFALATLLALAVVSSWPATDAPFVFDEETGIAANRALRPASPWSAALSYRYSPDQTRPLFFASLLLDTRLWGSEPRGFRLTGLALHLTTGILLYLLLRRPPGTLPTALAGTALFLLHPLQSESVLYIWGRSEILSTMFMLAALLLATPAWPERGRDAAVAGATSLSWGGALACATLALAAKEEAVVLPLIALIWWIAVDRRRGPAAAGGALLLAVPAVLFLLLRSVALGTIGRQVFARGVVDNILGQAVVTLRMARLLIWPAGQSIDHAGGVPRLGSGLLAISVCIAVAMAACVTLRGAWSRTTGFGGQRRVIVGRVAGGILVAFAGTALYWLVPLPDLMCERRIYLPMIGAALIISGALMPVESLPPFRRTPSATLLIPAIMALLLAPAYLARARVWSDPHRLWQEAADRAPGKARPLVNLGVLAARDGHAGEAAVLLDRAVALEPANAEARFNRGRLRFEAGNLGGAQEDFEAALVAAPAKLAARLNLAAVRIRRNDLAGAERDLLAVLDLDPEEPRALTNLAEIRRAAGRTQEAIDLLRDALAADPSYARAAARLGVTLEAAGDVPGALAAYREYLARGAESAVDAEAVRKKIAALERDDPADR